MKRLTVKSEEGSVGVSHSIVDKPEKNRLILAIQFVPDDGIAE
jgi:hypothetical protein